MGRGLDVLTSFAASTARLGFGVKASRVGMRPEKPIELYDMEACPYCRKVRDTLTALDLEAMVYPCPKGGSRFRPTVVELGGKTQFPFVVDPSQRVRMYESDDIVAYLYAKYGSGRPSLLYRGPLALPSSLLASAFRPRRGLRVRPSRVPEQALQLYSFEESPYCRLVREVLCELELPYHLINAGKGSNLEWLPRPIRQKLWPNHQPGTDTRQKFAALSGKVQVPWLRDPNNDIALFESANIVRYLEETYAAP